ncbi:MAG: hypothetical protein E7191_08545 [Erysipelotrichaceae bacterium]|nr:hypothetical protein [Erysipelotrichaceae bacterium]MBR3694484.1 hypothetical protein [Erysipelotrichales bacterium]
MRKLWLLCSSILLAAMYLFTITPISTPSITDTASALSATRNAVVEVGVQVKKTSEKQEVRYRHIHVLLPFLPVVAIIATAYTVTKKQFRVVDRLFYNSAFVPSLGANAPPVYMY